MAKLRSEVDPVTVARPRGAGILGRVSGHPPRRPALRVHHEDVYIVAGPLRKDDAPAIRRPTWRKGTGSLSCDLDRIRTIRTSSPHLGCAGSPRDKGDAGAVRRIVGLELHSVGSSHRDRNRLRILQIRSPQIRVCKRTDVSEPASLTCYGRHIGVGTCRQNRFRLPRTQKWASEPTWCLPDSSRHRPTVYYLWSKRTQSRGY